MFFAATTALILSTVVAVVGSVIGAALGQLRKNRLELMVHIATGALLGITAFDILPEAKAVLPWGLFIGASIFGYAMLWLVGRFVFYVCPSCAISHMDDETAMARRGSLILLASALGVHCILDGLALTTGSHLSSRAEFGALLGVGLHKFPEGLALGLLLVGAHYKRVPALLIATGIELLTVAGGIVGFVFAATPTPMAVGIIFALVGGGFVYLVTNALSGAVSHSSALPRSRWIAAEAASFAVTGLFLWAASQA